MADEVHQFTVTIPAGTTKAAPYTQNLPLYNCQIDNIDVEVPPGPQGLMGFYLALSGQQWIPYEQGTYIVWDDNFSTWTLTNQPTSAGWQLVGYNTDVYAHEVTIRFHVSIIPVTVNVTAPTLTFITSPSTVEPIVL